MKKWVVETESQNKRDPSAAAPTHVAGGGEGTSQATVRPPWAGGDGPTGPARCRRVRRDRSGELTMPDGGAGRREAITPASGKHLHSGQIPTISLPILTQKMPLSMMGPIAGPDSNRKRQNSDSQVVPPVRPLFDPVVV